MSALQWLRNTAAAEPKMSNTFEYEGRLVKSTHRFFKGVLPFRMREELRHAKLMNEDMEHESLRICRTPSGFQTGVVEFYHVKYEVAE